MEWVRAAAAWISAAAFLVLASSAEAQQVYVGDDLPEGDWMTSGLAPLVLLLGLGIVVALVAAGVAAVLLRSPRRRFGGPREA
ncbi:hypothetical protein [Sandaracinus amylolyticus]|uniref:hypothetical protein n=1 Tax=Sandaracinus amylolyticus TaxID=927083 RepID=UPI001F461D93|nr:hypothetical protein [Sandaracinus amylolyticus]UJR85267.1 Hypothetical protein I5071_73470 [Sandaracinus amylolyticus]